MEPHKQFIQNRDGKKLAVVTELQESPRGLAFVMHGLGGFKEQPHMRAMCEAFSESGFDVVSWDASHTFGESEGNCEEATITSYYQDLEDVITWAREQSWFQEPFALAGHSLGGIGTALYAEKHPEHVKALAPISSVVSGGLSLEAERQEDYFENWEKTGWMEKPSRSKPGLMKRLPWSHMEDRLKYDLLPGASKLIMPVLLIVGEFDVGVPLKHQQLLLDALPGPKKLHVIRGAEHTFYDAEHIAKEKEVMSDWIASWV